MSEAKEAPSMSAAAASSRGPRSANEDTILCRVGEGELQPTVVVVADGMGGHVGGATASHLAVEAVKEALCTAPNRAASPQERREWLARTVGDAHHAILDRARQEPDLAGMGSTIVAGVAWRDGFAVANVGDSRALIVSHADIEQLTQDHSAAAEQIRAGKMTASEARNHPYSHALTRCLGGDPEVEVDLFPRGGGLYPMSNAASLVLVSDGVWNVISEFEIADQVLGTAGPREAAEGLIAQALAQGTDDNVSAAVLEFGVLLRDPARSARRRAPQVDSALPPEPRPMPQSGRVRDGFSRALPLALLGVAMSCALVVAVWSWRALREMNHSAPIGALPVPTAESPPPSAADTDREAQTADLPPEEGLPQ